LDIIIDGVKKEIPANIGILENGCFKEARTNDTSGTIFLESFTKNTFTLADFFTEWGKTFNTAQILDSTLDNQHTIVMTVNETTSYDYERLPLVDQQRILINYKRR
ncbi:MAG: hypothetical protein AAB611_01770, partial [Patescibacteria group bacterium]